jgi:hypothetical protein
VNTKWLSVGGECWTVHTSDEDWLLRWELAENQWALAYLGYLYFQHLSIRMCMAFEGEPRCSGKAIAL